MKTIAFFGHRTILNKNDIKERLTTLLKKLLTQGFRDILIGSHGEFDEIALEVSLNCKKKIDKNLKVSVVLTSLSCLNKDKSGFSKIDFYKNSECETVFYDIEETYFKNYITFSNKKMIDNSELIICCVDMRRRYSGAKTAINYAVKKNKKIINLFNDEDKEFCSN